MTRKRDPERIIAALRLEIERLRERIHRLEGRPAPRASLRLRRPPLDAKKYRRDQELREAARAAERQASWDWTMKPETRPPWANECGARTRAMAEVRAAARAEVRARWEQEDAELAKPLSAGLERLAPGAVEPGWLEGDAVEAGVPAGTKRLP